ncbi:POU domain, class 6, transcription factor 2 [Takifugu flavidus]|uniref:POU domain, class 6, transcription factor 2 n=1 Tax=Takifugu flavidus TaxID=433684 RepID=A0A5C6NW76_9TELE|nr:POU domain, class 6, transcription factor 2 [Takifugu flavidus]
MCVYPRASNVSTCPHFILLSVALPGGRDGSVQSDASSSPSEQSQLGQSHPGYPIGPQSLLVAQQLANAVGGVMSGAAPGMNQPILIPFNAGGHLGGQQGLVLSLPTANIQSLVAAAAAGGIMTLPLQNLQGKKEATADAVRPIRRK